MLIAAPPGTPAKAAARLSLLDHAAGLLDEFAREQSAAGSLEQARRDEGLLVANGLRNLVAELRAEAA